MQEVHRSMVCGQATARSNKGENSGSRLRQATLTIHLATAI
jgi:hypothetical protein